MAETFRVLNTSHRDAIFTIYAPLGDLDNLPRHKRRKALGRGSIPVKVPAHHAVDLVQETGLRKADLQGQPELNNLLYGPRPTLEVIVLESDLPEKAPEPVKAVEKPTVVPTPEVVQAPEPALAIPPEPTPFAAPPVTPTFAGLAEAVASGGAVPAAAPVVRNKGGRPPKTRV